MFSHDRIFGSDEQHQLSSVASFMDQKGSFDVEVLDWEERLRLQHSPNFLTNYTLRLMDATQQTFTNKEIRGTAGFEHKLYDSLKTTGNIFKATSDLGNQGNLDAKGGMLAFHYTKKNPWGTLLGSYSAALTGEEYAGDSSGVGVVIDEAHVFTDPLPVALDRVNIDTSTIVVTDGTGLDGHNPHSTRSAQCLPPAVPGAMWGVSGLTATGVVVQKAQYEYEVCFKCHGDNPDRIPSTITRQITQTNARLEFQPSNPSFHPVVSPGANRSVPSLRSPLTGCEIIFWQLCGNGILQVPVSLPLSA